MVAELIRRAGGSRSLRGRVVAFGLDRTRQLAGLRERPKYVLVLQLALLRAQLQRVGETLARRGVLDALGDGFLGALKNLLPLLVLAASLVVAWIVFVIAIAIVVFVFVLIGMLVGKWLVFAVIIPAYIAMVLVVFAAMFGVMYYLWRDVCGDDPASSAVQTIAV
jgi:CBS domain containing-hemolysin-like protein